MHFTNTVALAVQCTRRTQHSHNPLSFTLNVVVKIKCVLKLNFLVYIAFCFKNNSKNNYYCFFCFVS